MPGAVLASEAALVAASWLEIVTAAASVVTAVSLVLGIIGARIALHQLGESKLARQSEFIAGAVREWDDQRITEARARAMQYNNRQLREAVAELHAARSPELAVLLRIPDYFEFLAFAADASRISLEVVWRMFGGPATVYWDLWAETIKYLREQTNDPRIYIEFENLVRQLKLMPAE